MRFGYYKDIRLDDLASNEEGENIMNNSDMKANRFKRWADAKKKLVWIKAQASRGLTVYLSTYTNVTKITEKQLELVTATKNGLFIQHGKQKICHDYSKITAEF